MAKILLVEDNEDLAGLLEVMLQSEKHTVEILHDGDEAREMLRIYKYDAVILDWDLPDAAESTCCCRCGVVATRRRCSCLRAT